MAGFEIMQVCRAENAKAADVSSDQAERESEEREDTVKSKLAKADAGIREGLPRSLWLSLNR